MLPAPATATGSPRTGPGSTRRATKLIETQFSARLRLGDVGDVIGELEAAVATYPFQEGLWELLITALYRARTPGRRAGDVPAGPDPAGRRARARSRTAAAAARATDPARPRLGVHPRRPIARPPGTCRRCRPSWSVARRRSPPCPTCSHSERLVEIVGPGGIGKTAVAIATGRSDARPTVSPGGVWLARLETATTADDVLDTLIAALNVTGGEAALFERLKGTAALVILDNCEHVIDAAAALAVRLLDAAPGAADPVHQPGPLDVDGEAVFELAPLALADLTETGLSRRTNKYQRSLTRFAAWFRRPEAPNSARPNQKRGLIRATNRPIGKLRRPRRPPVQAPPRAKRVTSRSGRVLRCWKVPSKVVSA